MERNSYRALDFFMIRTPILPFDTFLKCFPSSNKECDSTEGYSVERLIQLAQQPVIREALLVASPSLYRSLLKLDGKAVTKNHEQLITSIMKYVIRMMSRPTPFGLFSGVMVGQFASESQLNLNGIPSYKKRARPDMEWVLKLIELLEEVPGVVEQLRIFPNSLVYRQGNRAKIPYVTRFGKMDYGENDSISIKATIVFDFIMECLDTPITCFDLVERLKMKFPGTDSEIVIHYVKQLLKQEFLITEMRPSTIDKDPFQYILSVVTDLSGIDEIKGKLIEIKSKIDLYNQSTIGAGLELFAHISNLMNELIPIHTPALQVDVSLVDQSLRLNEHIRADVEQTAGILNGLSYSSNQHLKEYVHEFLEKYGDHKEVPLLELIDDELGLGAPATYRHPESRRRVQHTSMDNSRKRLKQEQRLMELLLGALHKGNQKLELTENEIQELLTINNSSNNTNTTLPSMELYFSLYTQNRKTLDKGEYTLVLGPNSGSNGAGKTFGRFMDIFDPAFQEQFKIISEEEQKICPDQVWAEVTYLPSSGKTTNVMLTKNYRNYEIALGTTSSLSAAQQIKVSDLVVGVDGDNLYIKSIHHDKEIIPTVGHMLNYQQTPNVYRFLIEVGLMKFEQWSAPNFGFMLQAPFTPRIQYKRIVLSPAKWKLRLPNRYNNKEHKNGKDAVRLREWITDFIQQWNVPRYVYLIDSDHRILLDIEHPLHMNEILKILSKTQQVDLIEHVGGFEELPIRQEEGLLTAEFVFPLVNKNVLKSDKESNFAYRTAITRKNSDYEVHFPGGDWFYAKLYGLDSRQNEFIALHWADCIEQARAFGLIDFGYFIRYADPEPHIRVRFRIKSRDKSQAFAELFHEWSTTWFQDGFLTKFIVDAYEPEIERYGGVGLMKLAEEVFSSDSLIVSKLIRLIRFEKPNIEIEQVAIMSVVHLLNQLGYSPAECYKTLNQKFDVKEYLDEYRNIRKSVMGLLNTYFEWSTTQIQSEADQLYHDIFSVLRIRNQDSSAYFKQLVTCEQQKSLTNSPDDIVFSIIHMHLNRLIGIDRKLEHKIMIMSRHAMNSIVQYHQKVGSLSKV
ncbi:lantibiotic dehydratase [Paenibacillus sp. ACRSA]|uniref:lantibiotic dehydratase n=1 Tax=Paenibacillus sp. ACRSA TaxID=2918211 RepID=UPI001EF5B092|nr:lantibiotic dehydratase [Paenibacillus sp. ACRSA]MCG7376550.1 lantibiotic dehydratase [Paenibacillus sp. ACRSA]